MDQLIFASLSHTHYWYEVGMLKVAAYGVVDVMRFGAWLRSGEGIGWLAAGTTVYLVPNSLYRVPFFLSFSGMCLIFFLSFFVLKIKIRTCFVFKEKSERA